VPDREQRLWRTLTRAKYQQTRNRMGARHMGLGAGWFAVDSRRAPRSRPPRD
jgi:hypothetical protein